MRICHSIPQQGFRSICSHIQPSFFFARMCLKRKSEKIKIARPKINNKKCPPCGRTSNYRKSWAPRPQQLETPRLQKKSLSPTLVQPTSWRWYLSCIRACAKLRNTRGVFFACFVADCDGLLFADSCSWMLDQLSVEKSTIDCPKRPRRTRLAVHLACWVTRTSKRWRVAPLLRFLHKRWKSCPSSHSPSHASKN